MLLSNQDIWLGYPNLKKLSEVGFPPETSEGIAALVRLLQEPYALIEYERTELVNRYGKLEKGTKQIKVDRDNPHAFDYALAFSELLRKEREVELEKVRLPERITVECQACGRKTGVVYTIHPNVLVPLVGKFLEHSGNGKGARTLFMPPVAKTPSVTTEANCIYYSVPMQIYMTRNVKVPLLEAMETLIGKASLIAKVKALWRLRKAWRDLNKIPEPTIENTWHPDTRNLIKLRDWLLERLGLDKKRRGFVRGVFDGLIRLHAFDPPWRFIMGLVRDEAFKMDWKPAGHGDRCISQYTWWREKK